MQGLLLSLALGLLVGCSPLGLLNALVPSGGYMRTADVPYGPLPRQRLDVYRPRGAQSPLPVVVFFYGGRWQSGSREEYRFAAQALASRGFVVVVPDYRLYPEVVFPAFVQDGARAVRWAFEHISRFGGDPGRLHVMGHSAGAHIALLLALDAVYLREQGLAPGVIRGVVGLAGPYDFLPFESADIRALMGPPERWPQTQPVRFAHGSAPPTLLLHGLDDTTVAPRNAWRLAARLREERACVQLILYPGVDHVELLLALAAPLRAFHPPVPEHVVAFLQRPTCGASTGARAPPLWHAEAGVLPRCGLNPRRPVGASGAYYTMLQEEAKADSSSWHNSLDVTLAQVSGAGSTDHIDAHPGLDGPTGWRGIAEILGNSGCTMTNGRLRLDRSYLDSASYTRTNRKHVACQEVGHLLGLHLNTSSGTTCMNDRSLSAPYPNSHGRSLVDGMDWRERQP